MAASDDNYQNTMPLLDFFLIGPTVQRITSTTVQGNLSSSCVKRSVLPFMKGRGFVETLNNSKNQS